MKFLRNLLASILGFFISIFIIFFIFVGIVSLIGKEDEVVVKIKYVLELDLKNYIKDYDKKE